MYFVWSAIKAIEADAFMDLLQNRHEAKICMLCYVTLRYVMLCYVTICNVMKNVIK